MKICILHTADALEDPIDPVLDQIENALREGGHETGRLVVDDSVQPLVTSFTSSPPDL
ncbi:MAG: D-alanine--D-alanine ligase, partial [Gemmatimonadaceae bacterium]|nr:D-alanine--D-alanine ligase [Gemmatimonadaceae bacterium]